MHDRPLGAAGRYGIEVAIMRWMGWGWRELLEAPADLVEEIAFRMAQEHRWTNERRELDRQMR